jgi:ribosome-binding factor A
MAGKSARHQRIESEMHRVLAELISREVKDPRVGHVTITAVEMLRDMSAARVLFVPFGNEHTAEQVHAGLTRASGFMRGEVGRRLSLRHAPRLEFELDVSIERAQHLTQLIDGAVKRDRGVHQDASDPDASDHDNKPADSDAD